MFPTTSTTPLTFEPYLLDHNATDSANLDGWRMMFERQQFIDANAPTVIPPCPAWCILPAGHEYDSTDGFGADLVFVRRHVAYEGAKMSDVSVTERNHYGAVTVDEPSIFLAVEADEATVTEVRAIAAELLEAAAALEGLAQ